MSGATTSADHKSASARRFTHGALTEYARAVLGHLDVPDADAREVADNLVLAELRGVDSHGLIRLPVYARRLKAGVLKARPAITARTPFPAVALVDGDNGLGAVVGARAMERAIEIARTQGTGFVGVRHSNHFGPAAFYVEKAVRQGFVGCAISNAPPNMAAFGGRVRFLGTNPFAIGIPAGKEPPLVFDASSSVAARGKIIAAAERDVPIPAGWAIDLEGRPTTDARAALAGAVLPFGGAKGSAISFIIDVISGVLSGAAFALHLNTLENLGAEQDLGHAFFVVRTDLFQPAEEFGRRMDEILGMLKATPPAAGIERVLVPGELERRTEGRLREEGIPVPPEVLAQLQALGRECGVGFPAPIPTTESTRAPCPP
jgi:LDH2 family malate/lactate/ureidoglycolate dehydrogenase